MPSVCMYYFFRPCAKMRASIIAQLSLPGEESVSIRAFRTIAQITLCARSQNARQGGRSLCAGTKLAAWDTRYTSVIVRETPDEYLVALGRLSEKVERLDKRIEEFSQMDDYAERSENRSVSKESKPTRPCP